MGREKFPTAHVWICGMVFSVDDLARKIIFDVSFFQDYVMTDLLEITVDSVIIKVN